MRFIPLAALALSATVISAPAHAGAPTWNVNKGNSHLGFGVAVNNQGVKGEFRRWDAQIAFDPKALNQSRVAATIEMGSAVTGEATRDQSLPTADWFNVAAFPRATFVATNFKDLGVDAIRPWATSPFVGCAARWCCLSRSRSTAKTRRCRAA